MMYFLCLFFGKFFFLRANHLKIFRPTPTKAERKLSRGKTFSACVKGKENNEFDSQSKENIKTVRF